MKYNYYDVLEVSQNASKEVIKAAYKTLAKRYHPDTNDGQPLRKDIDMVLINEAYEVLSDDIKRKRYDETLKVNCDESYQYQQDKSDLEDDEENQTGGWFSKVVKSVGKEIVRTAQNNQSVMENAYLSGLAMDDYVLVRRFKQARGYKRLGYAKALEEKGYLERNGEGKLIPTYRYKKYL